MRRGGEGDAAPIGSMTIQQDMATILRALAQFERDHQVHHSELAETTALDPGRTNDAVQMLEDSGYVDVVRTMGNRPFDFNSLRITAAGRYELERAEAEAQSAEQRGDGPHVRPSPWPVGSPFGFVDEDWEYIDRERKSERLIVVFGHQFESEHFDAGALAGNLEGLFRGALEVANADVGTSLSLDFVALRAGYGEHLFNQIARSIIASDIAVFETSDLNPNVMIEMGVALTWGIRVHPIRHSESPKPPSDISGQTWASYHDDGTSWEDDDYSTRIASMVKLALRRKASNL